MPSNAQQIAEVLAGAQRPIQSWSGRIQDEPGAEMPPEMKALSALNTIGSGYGAGQMGAGLARLLATEGLPALQGLGEAGAFFPPENMKLPPGMTKGDLLTPAERAYHTYENNEQLYLHNEDFANALKAKWGMLKNAGGN